MRAFDVLLILCLLNAVHCRLRLPHQIAFGSSSSISDRKVLYEEYFEQTLDHFNFGNITTFSQRYLLNNASWTGPPAPIFVYCGNEGDIEWFAQNTGLMFEIAPQFEALLVFPEHRFYGKSMPFGGRDNAYSGPATLQYLSAEQALADYATLITDLKKNLSAGSSPVVSFGGSYGGMLAAWFRLKYPHITIGALASSAPILQFEDIVPKDSFYNIVSNDFKKVGNGCFEVIRDSWDPILEMAQDADGLRTLSAKFHMCRQFKSAGDVYDFLDSAYAYLAMVDYPYASNFMMPLPAFPVREVCKAIIGAPANADVYDRIYAGINIYYNFTGDQKCFDLDDDPHGLSGWNWQACTEMVMPMSVSNESMFPPYEWTVENFKKSCSDGAVPRPSWVTTEFGGHNISHVLQHFASNIVFSNGLVDPWSGGGVLQNISNTVVAFVTDEGAHHLDLRWSTKGDPEWLVRQRTAEISEIERWLREQNDAHHVAL